MAKCFIQLYQLLFGVVNSQIDLLIEIGQLNETSKLKETHVSILDVHCITLNVLLPFVLNTLKWNQNTSVEDRLGSTLHLGSVVQATLPQNKMIDRTSVVRYV